ncbi:lysophospholipid acyltransferase family protein [Cryptosporangium arvum]|uniref:1-acyl-sn-glycerol-3-phosphate acyltransferase n=1 Tax=Cryptosporangium arvum DSM 44712 TaxID=927661 RepID=A0A010YKL3_9ACTN|nr:lysophospholipid acyltransferase family protein [Cryptosporangium arvum]EXG80745.1 1-acyl-sn-glycerol-3-phosphate acyltransferase [Cryptosporangium arvum DSM 44712]
MAYDLSKKVGGPILHLAFRPWVEGRQYVPESGAAILASNHLSIMDSVFLPLVLDRDVIFVAKQEYFTGTRPIDRLTARFMRNSGQLPVNRGNNRAAQEALDASLGVLKAGGLFGIYPEGTRSPDARLYRGRTGVAWLALTADVPVVPVAMLNTERALPPGSRVPRPVKVGIRFGPPMTFEDFKGQAGKARARRAVTDQIVAAIGELSGQEYVPHYAPKRNADPDADT